MAAVRLPLGAEALSPYLPQASCDPQPKPGVVAFAQLMLATFRRGHDGGTVRACAVGALSEHKEGRAWDWMLDSKDAGDRLVATTVLAWLVAPGPNGEPAWNARRFGIMYVIWDGRIWASYRAADGWRPYTGASEHADHIHFSFSWSGAQRRTSWWTGTVAAVDYGPCATVAGQLAPRYTKANARPCPALSPKPQPTPKPQPQPAYAKPGDRGPHSLAVQTLLGVRPLSGWYGPVTTRTVRAYQSAHRLPATGVVDQATAVAMRLVVASPPSPPPPPPVVPYAKPGDRGAHALAVQTLLGVRPLSGWYGPVTTRTVRAYQIAHRLSATGVVDQPTAVAMHLVAPPLPPPPPAPPFAKPGDRGARVVRVQAALGVRPHSGWFGPVTTTAVRDFQRAHRLAVTGVVDARTAMLLRVR